MIFIMRPFYNIMMYMLVQSKVHKMTTQSTS